MSECQNMNDALFRADNLGRKINEAKMRNNQLIDDLNVNDQEYQTNIDNLVQSPKFKNVFQQINETLQQSQKVQLNKYELQNLQQSQPFSTQENYNNQYQEMLRSILNHVDGYRNGYDRHKQTVCQQKYTDQIQELKKKYFYVYDYVNEDNVDILRRLVYEFYQKTQKLDSQSNQDNNMTNRKTNIIIRNEQNQQFDYEGVQQQLRSELDEKMDELERTIRNLGLGDSDSELSESEELYIKLKKKQRQQGKQVKQMNDKNKKVQEMVEIQKAQIEQLMNDLNDSNKQNYFLKNILNDRDKNVEQFENLMKENNKYQITNQNLSNELEDINNRYKSVQSYRDNYKYVITQLMNIYKQGYRQLPEQLIKQRKGFFNELIQFSEILLERIAFLEKRNSQLRQLIKQNMEKDQQNIEDKGHLLKEYQKIQDIIQQNVDQEDPNLPNWLRSLMYKVQDNKPYFDRRLIETIQQLRENKANINSINEEEKVEKSQKQNQIYNQIEPSSKQNSHHNINQKNEFMKFIFMQAHCIENMVEKQFRSNEQQKTSSMHDYVAI